MRKKRAIRRLPDRPAVFKNYCSMRGIKRSSVLITWSGHKCCLRSIRRLRWWNMPGCRISGCPQYGYLLPVNHLPLDGSMLLLPGSWNVQRALQRIRSEPEDWRCFSLLPRGTNHGSVQTAVFFRPVQPTWHRWVYGIICAERLTGQTQVFMLTASCSVQLR